MATVSEFGQNGGNAHLGEVALNHDEDDENHTVQPQGDAARNPSRGLCGIDRRSDQAALDETSSRDLSGAEDFVLEPGVDAEGLINRTVRFSAEHSGPLPDPATLRGYEAIVAGSASSIIEGFLEEQRANTELLRAQNDAIERLTKSESRAVAIGSITSAFIAIGGLVTGVILVTLGYTLAGIIVGGLPTIISAISRVVSASKGGQPDEK